MKDSEAKQFGGKVRGILEGRGIDVDSATLDKVIRAVDSERDGMLKRVTTEKKSMVSGTLNGVGRGGLATMPEVRKAVERMEYIPSIGLRKRNFLLGLLGLVLGP